MQVVKGFTREFVNLSIFLFVELRTWTHLGVYFGICKVDRLSMYQVYNSTLIFFQVVKLSNWQGVHLTNCKFEHYLRLNLQLVKYPTCRLDNLSNRTFVELKLKCLFSVKFGTCQVERLPICLVCNSTLIFCQVDKLWICRVVELTNWQFEHYLRLNWQLVKCSTCWLVNLSIHVFVEL